MMFKIIKSSTECVLTISVILLAINFNIINVHGQTITPVENLSTTVSTQSKKVIYLTFDLDMNGRMYQKYLKNKSLKWYDPALFSYLEENNVKATFFLSGLFVKTYPDLIKELALNKNFSFQNHSYDESAFTEHCYWLKTLKNDEAKIKQIKDTQDIIKQTTGQTPTYFRFPGICHDVKNDKLVENIGFKIDNGTIIPSDPFNTKTSKMVKIILDQAKDGGVVIMHGGGHNAPKSLEVLKQIVPELKSREYIFGQL